MRIKEYRIINNKDRFSIPKLSINQLCYGYKKTKTFIIFYIVEFL